jgi:hypothetical protein
MHHYYFQLLEILLGTFYMWMDSSLKLFAARTHEFKILLSLETQEDFLREILHKSLRPVSPFHRPFSNEKS